MNIHSARIERAADNATNNAANNSTNGRKRRRTDMTTHTILITGATAGIGRFAALYLARKGHRVFASGRNEAALAKLRADAVNLPLETVRLDVTDASSIEAAAAEILRRTNGRGIDALVNNAGWGM